MKYIHYIQIIIWKKENYLCSGPHSKGPLLDNINVKSHQFKALKLSTFIIKTHIDADSYLLTKDNSIIKVFNIIKIDNENHNDIIFICKKFLNVNPLYNKPISSTILNIYSFNNKLSPLYFQYPLNEVKNKMFLISSNNVLIALPLIQLVIIFLKYILYVLPIHYV